MQCLPLCLALVMTSAEMTEILDKPQGTVPDNETLLNNSLNVIRIGKSGENGCGDCGIVSPHHEHISKLKKEIISDKYPESPFGAAETEDDLFIGTVDKLQGQERQSVIVSYGITDVEQALAESEFVFSRNRLNVAITRAKKKCIVFLTDAVLSYPIEALSYDDPELIDGIDYVCGFRDYMKDTSIGCSDITVSDTIECYRKK